MPPRLRRAASGPAPAPFVVGVGRSGTTLLRLMLDAHPQLAIPPETGFIPALIDACRADGATPESALAAVTSHRRWGDFGIADAELEAALRALDPLDPGEAVRAFYRLYAERAGKPRWGDKTPGYTLHMRKIARAVPEARFVHLIRDGRDVALSRINTLALRPVPMKRVARRWKQRIRKARRQARRLDHYLELRYEALISDPEESLRTVCEFVELEFDPAMLDYHRSSGDRLSELDRDIPEVGDRPARSAAKRLALHQRTTRPPDPDRIGRWRTQMSAADREVFESIAGDLLLELGYPMDGEAPSGAALK